MDIKETWKQNSYCVENKAFKCREQFYKTNIQWAVHFHIGRNWDVLKTFLEFWNRFPKKHKPDVWLTYHNDQPKENLQEAIRKVKNYEKFTNKIEWLSVPNKGADILAYLLFIHEAKQKKINYLMVLKLHAKKSSDEWLKVMMNDLIPSTEWVEWFLDCQLTRNDLGMIVPICDNVDYINYSSLLELIVRSGIFPVPYYDEYRPIKQINQEYEYTKNQIKQDYPPPPNQYRQNNLLMDAHLAWHLQYNPLGFGNYNHHVFIHLQSSPYLTCMLQQVYSISGTMFWMNFDICSQLNERFPISAIQNEFEEAIIKDNIWNKKTHAWERFFGAYVSIQGYSILDIKHKINFRKLPQNMILQNFLEYEKIKNDKFSQIQSFFSSHKKQIQTKNTLPLFSKPQQTITRGFASGLHYWLPIFIKPQTKKTIKQWVSDNLIQESDKTWNHYWFPTAKECLNWIYTSPSSNEPITIWTPQNMIQEIISHVEKIHDIHKFAKLNIECVENSCSFITILDFIDQIANSFPKHWVVKFNNFPSLPTIIKQEDTLQNIQTIIENKKENIPFWGKSILNLLKDDYLRFEHFQLTQQVDFTQKNNIQQNRICIEIYGSFFEFNDLLKNILSNIEKTFQTSSSDFNKNQPFQTTYKYNLFGGSFNCNYETPATPMIQWFQNSNQGILNFYNYHPLNERMLNLYSSRNFSIDKTINRSWHHIIRSLTNNKVVVSQNIDNYINPSNGFLWNCQLFILPDTSNTYFTKNGAFPLTSLLAEKFKYIPESTNYCIAAYKTTNKLQMKNKEVWLVIYLFGKTPLHQIWMKVIHRAIDSHLFTPYFLSL